jgi:hypothetical protein
MLAVGSLFVRMAARKNEFPQPGVKFVLLLPGSVAAAKPKPPNAHGPKRKAPIICLQRVHKAVIALWLDKAIMSTSTTSLDLL